MAQKRVKTLMGQESRSKILQGISLVADFVKVTLGPKGRNIAFNQLGPLPTRIINDGVSIAEKVKSEDPFVQAGVEMVQEICTKTNNNAGDGTSQSALMAQIIAQEGLERVMNGDNPIDIKNELEADIKPIMAKLELLSNKVENAETIEKLATISGNNDPEIGKAVADIMREVGLNASIIIEKGNDEAIKTESVKGMWFEKGYLSPVFMTDTGRGVAEYTEPMIFLVSDDLRWIDDINGFFDRIIEYKLTEKQLVFIAKEIESEALQSLAKTHYERMTQGKGMHILCVEAPFIGPDQIDALEDIAVFTGGKVIGQAYGKKLSEISDPKEYAGTCEKIVVNSKTTTIIGSRGEQSAIDNKVDEIKALLGQKSKSEKITSEKLEQRLDMLRSGVGIIYAGGSTELEIKDRYLRLEDSVRASKSAIKKGYVAGGGLTYLNLLSEVESPILQKAFSSVMAQVAKNAGANASKILAMYDSTKPNFGYNAKTGEYCDLLEAGVIDATLVIENVIKNSISLASMFLTTEGIIVESMEEETTK